MFNRAHVCLVLTLALPGLSWNRWAQADPSAAATPPMGWNSFQNTNYGFYNEAYLQQVADAMVSSGLSAAGYNYLNLDGGWWQESLVNGNYVRSYLNSDDTYRLDPTRFPLATPGNPNSATLAPLADYVHAKGLKLGFYSAPLPDAGQNNPTVVGNGDQAKANQLAAWGVDFLKYDNYDAFPSAAAANAEYVRMGQALTQTGRPIVYSIHDGQQLGSKVSDDVNMWRTSTDIGPGFSSVLANFDNNFKAQAGPHHWADPDMLQIGDGGRLDIYAPKSGYTPSKNDFARIYSKTLPDEEKSAMSLWSMSAAPLLIGGDVRNLSAYDKYVLENTEVVAIDQDSKGLQARQVGNGGSVYYKPLSDGSVAVMLLNRSSTAATSLHFNWADIGISGGTAQVRDLWAHQNLGGFDNGYTTTVPPNGVAVLKVLGGSTPITAPPQKWTPLPPIPPMQTALDRTKWKASASADHFGDNPAANAIDGNVDTNWTPFQPQAPGQWFQIDMGAAQTFDRIVFSGGYPRGYTVQVSNDGRSWGAAVASGSFPSQITEVDFPAVTAQFIRITQTDTDPLGVDHAPFWSIDELNVFAPHVPEPAAAWMLPFIAVLLNRRRGEPSGLRFL